MRTFGDDAPAMMPESVDGVKRGAKKQHTFICDVSDDRRDRQWDKHKAASETVAGVYMRYAVSRYDRCGNMVSETPEDARMFKWGRLMYGCASQLTFAELPDGSIKLISARFCKKPTCPNCQWRRSLRWKSRMWKAVPEIMEAYPDARWLFLTLTVKNCDVKETKPTIQMMNRAWNRLLKREECLPILGYLRSLEITRGKDGTAHPHFHALLMVPPSMLTGRGYVKQKRWQEMWKECLGIDYDPIIDIRKVKGDEAAAGDDDAPEGFNVGIAKAIKETAKYTTKEAMNVGQAESIDAWYYELSKQLVGAHLISTGGVIREFLKVKKKDELGQESDDDFIHYNEESDKEKEELEYESTSFFTWDSYLRRYILLSRRSKDDPVF